MLSKNLKIKIWKTIILPVVLYGCKTWSLMLREKHRLRMSENRVLRRICGPKRDGGENCIMRSSIICTFTKYYYYDQIKKDEMGRWGDEKCTKNFCGKS
jgi:hypothetical protein